MCQYGGTTRKLCQIENCKECFEASFSSSHRANCWSSKNNKLARQVFKGADTKYYFNCNECKHEFLSKPKHIKASNSWCPFCASQQFCENDECNQCYEKSFASHPKSKFWSKKNEKLPGEYFKSSDKEAYFTCNVCNHDFLSKISNISGSNNWCSYCSNKKKCSLKDCVSCLKLKNIKII
jgi:hypothetical protein